MNIFRSPTLLFIGLFALVAYFFSKEEFTKPAEENKDSIIPENQYPRAQNYNQNKNDNDSVNDKMVIHSNDVGQNFLPSRKSNNDNNEMLWQRYSLQMPKVFMLSNAAKKGVDYSENNIQVLQQLARDGDILAQFVYGYYLSKKLESSAIKNGKIVDAAEWNSRTKEIRDLYITSAAHGIHASAQEMARIYSSEYLRDMVEALAWALIADAMRGNEEDKALKSVCTDKSHVPCSHDLLSKALDRAKSYLKVYSFKIEKS